MCAELTLVPGRSFGRSGSGYSRHAMADEGALGREEVLARVRARILGLARARLSSPADAEDLAQETMLVLTTKYAHVAAPEELIALGVQTLVYKRAAFWRKLKRRREKGETALAADDSGADPLDGPSGAPDPEAEARSKQRLSMLVEAVSRLEGRCREIFRRKLEGASYVEIAADLGRPVNTIYSWDYRCHERLKTALAENWAFVSGEAS